MWLGVRDDFVAGLEVGRRDIAPIRKRPTICAACVIESRPTAHMRFTVLIAIGIVLKRFTHQRLEHPVKVERRKERGTRHRLQAQRLSKVTHDVIDHPVDPLEVRDRCGRSLGSASSQDLASPLSDRRVS